MIDKKEVHKEKSKLSHYIPKPGNAWFEHGGNPEQMGLHQKQRTNKTKKKKR